MSQVVPDQLELEIINDVVGPNLSLRLYGNNATPAGSSTAASFTEISGGGYAAKPLVLANWTITAGDPSQAVYSVLQQFIFTGTINAPGTIYGYFVTRDSDGHLMWAERFAPALVPFAPIAGSQINIIPVFSAQSQF